MKVIPWLSRAVPPGRIAPLGSEHASALAAIHATAFNRPWSAIEFERLLADRAVLADGLFFGPDDEPAGFALSRVVIDEAEILTIAVAAPARGKGRSRLLLAQHLEGLLMAGARKVHLEVDEGNEPALRLYRGLGFAETGKRPSYYSRSDGGRTAALTMSRAL